MNSLFQFHFIGDTALASSLTPSRTKCTVCVVRSSLPCFTFEIELELSDWVSGSENIDSSLALANRNFDEIPVLQKSRVMEGTSKNSKF